MTFVHCEELNLHDSCAVLHLVRNSVSMTFVHFEELNVHDICAL